MRQLHWILVTALLVVALPLAAGHAPAQAVRGPRSGEWVQQAPLPTGSSLESDFMLNADEGWAVGQDGAILHTTDGGAHWTRQTSNTEEPLNAVHFHDPLHGWATGNVALYTTDGGTTWLESSGMVGSHYAIDFVDLSYGWMAGGGGSTFRTTDGGQTWSWVYAGSTDNLKEVDFVDRDNGWAVGAEGTIWHTVNGGLSWTAQSSGTNAYLDGLAFVNANEGWASGGDDVLHTTNGGQTWLPQSVPSDFWSYGLHFSDTQHGWSAGERRQIYHTSDGGATWTLQATSGTMQRLWDVHFGDALHGVATGERGAVYTTGNGGATWTDRRSGSSTSSNDLAAVDTQNAWSANSLGEVLYTHDGGMRWNVVQAQGEYSHLYGIDFADKLTGWVVGEGDQLGFPGVILKSTDGGLNWSEQWLGTALDPVFGVAALDDQTVVAVGGPGVLRTSDGGASWADIPTPPTAGLLKAVYFLDSQLGWAAGTDGTVLKTTNGGLTWSGDNILLDSDALEDISFSDASHGWVVGRNGKALRSTDGGQTWVWQFPDPPNNAALIAVAAISANEAWIAGGSNYVGHTTDGGASWTPHGPASSPYTAWSDLVFPNPGFGWVGGSGISPGGGIWLHLSGPVATPSPTSAPPSTPTSTPPSTPAATVTPTQQPPGHRLFLPALLYYVAPP
jgi:photosystem II stability/assembly factor-like uncharacterized protein